MTLAFAYSANRFDVGSCGVFVDESSEAVSGACTFAGDATLPGDLAMPTKSVVDVTIKSARRFGASR